MELLPAIQSIADEVYLEVFGASFWPVAYITACTTVHGVMMDLSVFSYFRTGRIMCIWW